MGVRINVFAGARRIAWLVTGVAALGTATVLALSPPHVNINVQISRPLAGLFLTEDECPESAATNHFSHKIDGNRTVWVSLCMLPMDFQSRQLIPYKVDGEGMIYGAERHSTEVYDYGQAIEKRFQLSPSDVKVVIRKILDQRIADWMQGLKYLAISLLVFWGAVWSIGWIVRGFLGIPLGQDRRPSAGGA